ncbi:MAG: hypothetical protein WDZ60_01115 [Wenzhouxiangellaceae bacterium]
MIAIAIAGPCRPDLADHDVNCQLRRSWTRRESSEPGDPARELVSPIPDYHSHAAGLWLDVDRPRNSWHELCM